MYVFNCLFTGQETNKLRKRDYIYQRKNRNMKFFSGLPQSTVSLVTVAKV